MALFQCRQHAQSDSNLDLGQGRLNPLTYSIQEGSKEQGKWVNH
jgi:hypothetical protein